MVLATTTDCNGGAGGDTQLMDIDSLLSDCETDDGCGVVSDRGEEKNSILYGEIQVLDDSESTEEDGCGRFDEDVFKTQLLDTCDEAAIELDGVKTQLLDTYQETESVDDHYYNDSGSERTEVLSDEDGSTGGRTARRLSYGEIEGPERMPSVDISGLIEQKDKEDLVDSDASTDFDDNEDDYNAGSSRKSFTAVRAAAVRSSGLASACYVSSKKLSHDMDGLKDGNATAGNMSSESIRLDNWKKEIRDLSSLSSKTTDLDVSRMPTHDFYKEGVESGSGNAMVRKLFDEAEPSDKADSMINTELISDQEDLYLSGTDQALAGLSYIKSQEPGEFSQSNALEIVDKFILINDMESSEEIKNPKSDINKCSVSCIKGAQLLAEKTVKRSPVGKVGIFEWNDNLEDEEVGDFFCKRKDTLFDRTSSAQKSKCHLSRANHSVSAIGRDAFSKSRKTKDADPSYSIKNTFANSDSRLIMQHSPKFSMIHNSEANTRKSLFKDIDEQSNSGLLGPQLEVTNGEKFLQDAYDVGPNTQMAAEVLESLVHVSSSNPTKKDKSPHSRISINKSSKISATKEVYSENIPFQKRTLTADSVGVVTRAKRRNFLSIDTTIQNPKSCIDHSGNTRAKNRSEKTTSKARVKNDKLKVGTKVCSSSINGNLTSKSINKFKTKGNEDTSFLDDAKKIHGRMELNDRILAQKEFTDRDVRGNCAPVASRTRQSKKLMKRPEALPKEDGFHENVLIDENTEGAIQKQHSLDPDASRLMETRIGIPNKVLHTKEGSMKIALTQPEVQIHGMMFQGELNAALENSAFNHPKRRRTQISSGNQSSNNNTNDPSVSENVMAKVERNSKQVDRKKVYIRSVADKIITRSMKRSVSDRILMESDHLSLTKCKPMTSGVKTRLSLDQMDLNDNSNEHLSNLTSPKTRSKIVDHHSNGEVNHTSLLGEVISCKSGADYNGNIEYDATSEGVGSNKEIAVVSPVCLAKDPPKTPKKTSLATLLARELHRLETVVASTSPILKDVRRRKDMASVRVLFSQHLDEDTIKQQKKILVRLGLKVASSISDATHFVTNKFVRTQNMLEAIAVGKPVVTPMWLESCGQEHCFIDERNYIMRDYKKEKEIGFSLPVSLSRACQCPLLKNKRVYVTPKVKPSQSVITSLVIATYGQAIERIGRSMMKQDKVSDDLLVISCDEDYSICLPLLKKGYAIFSSELLLNGIVIQKLEYERHRLFLDHVKRTRSTIWFRTQNGGKTCSRNKSKLPSRYH